MPTPSEIVTEFQRRGRFSEEQVAAIEELRRRGKLDQYAPQILSKFKASMKTEEAPIPPAPPKEEAPIPPAPPKEEISATQFGKNILTGIGGALDIGKTMASAAIAEPIAGLAGIAGLVTGGPERGAEFVEKTREAITMEPWSETGKTAMAQLGETIEPVLTAAEKPVGYMAEKAGEVHPTLGGLTGAAMMTGAGALAELGGIKGTRAAQRSALAAKAGGTGRRVRAGVKEAGLGAGDISKEGLKSVAETTLDPAQVARAKYLESQGFVGEMAPTRAQVMRSASEFRTQQELAKETGEVAGRLQNQNALLESKFVKAAKATGGDVPDPNSIQLKSTTGTPAADRVIDKATFLDNEIHDMYQKAREATDGEAIITPNRFKNAIEKHMSDNDLTGGLVKAIEGAGIRRGAFDKEGVVGAISVEQAEKIVQAINKRYGMGNPNANRVGRILKDAIDLDVAEAGGPALFKQARQKKAAFHRELEPERGKFSKRKASLPKDLLEEKIPADEFLEKGILSKTYRAEDIQHLKKYLTTGTPEQIKAGKKALADLRAEAIEWIRDKSFTGPLDEQGRRTISRSKFEKAYQRFGSMNKLKAFFEPEEVKFLRDMQKTLEMIEPTPGAFIGEGPSANAINRAMKSLERRAQDLPGFKPMMNMVFDPQGRALNIGTESLKPQTTGVTAGTGVGMATRPEEG